MKRLATSIAAAAWAGFLGVFAAELGLDLALPAGLAGVDTAAWPVAVTAHFDGIGQALASLGPSSKFGLAAISLALTGLFADGLLRLQRRGSSGAVVAERRLAAGLGGIAVLALAAQTSGLPLLPIDLGGGLVWVALAASAVAILFDRLVDVGGDEDEAEFEAGISAIAESLARQTRLYTRSHTRGGD
jgi:hypothetical protein